MLTYHPVLKQIIHSPADEYEQLRGPTPLAHTNGTWLKPYAPVGLVGELPRGVANASDILVRFRRPTKPATLGVVVMNGALTVFIELAKGQEQGADGLLDGLVSVQVGIFDGPPASAPPPPVGTKGNGTCGATAFGKDCDVDTRGAWDAHAENIANLSACVAKAKPCKQAEFVSYSSQNADCSWYSDCDFEHLCKDCSKCGIGCPHYVPYESEVLRSTSSPTASSAAATPPSSSVMTATPSPTAESFATAAPPPSALAGRRLGTIYPADAGAKVAGQAVPPGLRSSRADTLQLQPEDDELVLRVLVDRTLVEAFWMDGRVAMTSQIRPTFAVEGMPQVSVFSNSDGDTHANEATVWEMGSIWVSKEQVLATPRPGVREHKLGHTGNSAFSVSEPCHSTNPTNRTICLKAMRRLCQSARNTSYVACYNCLHHHGQDLCDECHDTHSAPVFCATRV